MRPPRDLSVVAQVAAKHLPTASDWLRRPEGRVAYFAHVMDVPVEILGRAARDDEPASTFTNAEKELDVFRAAVNVWIADNYAALEDQAMRELVHGTSSGSQLRGLFNTLETTP